MDIDEELDFPGKEHYPFKSKFIQIDGIKVHYIDECLNQDDNVEILLFLHGNPTWSFLYRDIIKDLRDEYRCIALDYPGFGLSEKPEDFSYLPIDHSNIVEKFVCKLGLNKINLMVHDWGGPIGLGFAGRRPDLIKRLIITNTWAWPMKKISFKIFSKMLGSNFGKRMIIDKNAFVNYIMPFGVNKDRKKFSQDELSAYRFPFREADNRLPTYIFPREISSSKDFLEEVESNLVGLVDKSTLIIWGKWDVAFRRNELEKFIRIFDPKKVVRLDAGHYLQEDKPQEICHYIKEFLIADEEEKDIKEKFN